MTAASNSEASPSLADRIRSEAGISDRPGQLDRLEALAAEVERLQSGARTLGHIIEEQGRMVLDVTGMHHVIDETGDGDWAVVWERLYELAPKAASNSESAALATNSPNRGASTSETANGPQNDVQRPAPVDSGAIGRLNEAGVREAVEGADARQWAEEWWRCHADDYFRAAMAGCPELVAYFGTITPTNMRLLLDEITQLRAALDEARQTAEQFQGANDDLREVIGNWRNKAEALTTERDEARAEVEREIARADNNGYRALALEQDRDEARNAAQAWQGAHDEAETRAEAAESALTSIRTLARTWSGRHDLLMTGDSAAHDIEAALAANTTTDKGYDR